MTTVDHGAVSPGPTDSSSIAAISPSTSTNTVYPRARSSVLVSVPSTSARRPSTTQSVTSVTTGPGSFTGLRVGLATAKLLAYAWECPLVAVDTLEVIARQTAAGLGIFRCDVRLHSDAAGTAPELPPDSERPPAGTDPQVGPLGRPGIAAGREWLPGAVPQVGSARVRGGDEPPAGAAVGPLDSRRDGETWVVVPVLNAFRGQVFAAAWAATGRWWHNVASSQVASARRWLSDPLGTLELSEQGERIIGGPGGLAAKPIVVVSGPGLETYPLFPKPRRPVAPSDLWRPGAEMVAAIGWELFDAGRVETALSLRPNYVRGSAAEENARGRQCRNQ